jgi:hypothetical protein
MARLLFLVKISISLLAGRQATSHLCTMNSAMRGPIAARPPSAGLDDLIIVPLVLVAVAISKLLKGVFSILIYVLDYALPILLQLMRIPLYRIPEIVTRGRFPDGGESDSTWRTQEARHVGSDTIASGF